MRSLFARVSVFDGAVKSLQELDMASKKEIHELLTSLREKLQERADLENQIINELDRAFSSAFDLEFSLLGKKIDVEQVEKKIRKKVEKDLGVKQKRKVKFASQVTQPIAGEIVDAEIDAVSLSGT